MSRVISRSQQRELREFAKVIANDYPYAAGRIEEIAGPNECGKALFSPSTLIGFCAEEYGTEHDHDSDVLRVRFVR